MIAKKGTTFQLYYDEVEKLTYVHLQAPLTSWWKCRYPLVDIIEFTQVMAAKMVEQHTNSPVCSVSYWQDIRLKGL